MRIPTADQIKELDRHTIEKEPVSSLDLMERASLAAVYRLVKLCDIDQPIFIFCGKGNNGGDGFAITRLLRDRSFNAEAILIDSAQEFSEDAKKNHERLKEKYSSSVSNISTKEDLSKLTLTKNAVVIDALLGTGLNRKPEGIIEEAILFINASERNVISIDIPSGLYADKDSSDHENVIVRTSLCLSFQFPKLSFLLPCNSRFVPEFEILDIGIKEEHIQNSPTNNHYFSLAEIRTLIKKRKKFSHKGNFGHALLLAGSKGKSGAALIAAQGCLRSGAGLLTVHSNKDTLSALLVRLPEAMSSEDQHSDLISEIDHPEKYNAIAFGPGVGTNEDTQQVLKKILHYYQGKLIIDADGLNILSENKTWLSFLPPNTILTPHPKEFERLTEKAKDDWERLTLLKQFVLKYNCIVVLKGAHTAIAMPDGNVFFNSSGNAGLAKGGSGDGLTGIILGLLARGYNAPQSALIGTFVHGLAADLLAKESSTESILISDVLEMLPKAFKMIEGQSSSN